VEILKMLIAQHCLAVDTAPRELLEITRGDAR